MSTRNPIIYGEKVDLDSKDKKILEQLQINARQSISSISKKTGLPRDVVKYRIKKLEENDVIRFYHAIINPAKLGHPMYTFVLFTLSNFDVNKEKEFIGFLKQHRKIVTVAKISGNWDIGLNICSTDFKDFDETMYEIRTKFSDIIKEFQVGSVIDEYKSDFMTELIN